MVHSLLSNSYGAVCLRNPPMYGLVTATHLNGRSRLSHSCALYGRMAFWSSEVKEGSLKLTLAALSMHVCKLVLFL